MTQRVSIPTLLHPHDAEASFSSIKDSYLLKSNVPPSHSEYLSLKTTRDSILVSLESVNASIIAMKSQLESLERKKIYLSELAEEYLIPLAPIRRIPVDVILCIFRELQGTWPEDSFNLKSGPWKLAQVSSSWRAILCDTPSFWNKININFSLRRPTYSNTILSTILNRTKSADLDIRFRTEVLGTYAADPFDCVSKRHLELLCSYSHRWKSFATTMPLSHWDCLRQVENTLLRLEVLSIDIVDGMKGFDETRVEEPCTFFAGAPKLKHLKLGMGSGPPPIPLSTAASEVSLRLHPLISYRLAKVVPNSVDTLSLYYHRLHEKEAPKPSEIALLPSVTCLIAEDMAFRYLTLPRLQRLYLSDWCSSQETIKELESFVSRSSLNEREGHHISSLVLSPSTPTLQDEARLLFAPFSFVHRLDLVIATAAVTSLYSTISGLLKELVLPYGKLGTASLPRLRYLYVLFLGFSCPRTRNLVYKVVKSRAGSLDQHEPNCGVQELAFFLYHDTEYNMITLLTFDQLRSGPGAERDITDSN